MAYLTKTPEGKKAVRAAVEVDVKKEAKKLANKVKDAQSDLPFSFGVDVGPVAIEPDSSGNITMSCDVEFDHEEARREAFYTGGRWDHGDLIYLYNNSWSYESDNPPWGMWHEKRTRAITSGPKNVEPHFVQRSVEDYLSSAPSGVDVEIADEYR
jgi:hypothetical protein